MYTKNKIVCGVLERFTKKDNTALLFLLFLIILAFVGYTYFPMHIEEMLKRYR